MKQYLSENCFESKLSIAKELIKSKFLEDKQASVLVYQNIFKDLRNKDIDNIKQHFYDGCIIDWASCDCLSSKVLKNWTMLSAENSEYISQWRFEKNNFWVRRACCVCFVQRAKHGDGPKNYKGFVNLMF